MTLGAVTVGLARCWHCQRSVVPAMFVRAPRPPSHRPRAWLWHRAPGPPTPAAGHGHATARRPALPRHALLLRCLGWERAGPTLHAARRPAGPVSVDVLLAARALGDSLPRRHLSVNVALPLLSGAAQCDGAIPRSSSCRSGCADDSPVLLSRSGAVGPGVDAIDEPSHDLPCPAVPLAIEAILLNSP